MYLFLKGGIGESPPVGNKFGGVRGDSSNPGETALPKEGDFTNAHFRSRSR